MSLFPVTDFSEISVLWGTDPEDDREHECLVDDFVDGCHRSFGGGIDLSGANLPQIERLYGNLAFCGDLRAHVWLYHGNVVQAIYASILGCLMAILLEISGSLWASILFHVGANLVSVLFSEYAVTLLQWHDGIAITAIMGLLFLVFWGGIFYFRRNGKRVRKTAY